MTPKILFTDLDGTLLNQEKQISKELHTGLQTMLHNGHKLVLASGRAFPSILKVLDVLDLDTTGIYISAYNGAAIYDCSTKEFIHKEEIALEDALTIIDLALQEKLHIQTYHNNSIITSFPSKELEHYTKNIPLSTVIQHPISDVLPCDVPKLVSINLDNKQKLIHFQQTIANHLAPRIITIFSNEYYLEIISSKAGKGKSLEILSDYLQIDIANTYAVGDAENDLTMLQASGTGCAMSNATDLLKSHADHILTKSNNEDGVLELLQHFSFL
ncbi:MAG: Cof-type HAD-IIB family hydrolase [Eubacteriales bacterium]